MTTFLGYMANCCPPADADQPGLYSSLRTRKRGRVDGGNVRSRRSAPSVTVMAPEESNTPATGPSTSSIGLGPASPLSQPVQEPKKLCTSSIASVLDTDSTVRAKYARGYT